MAYKTAFASGMKTVDVVTKFFRDVLMIRPCSWVDHMVDLGRVKKSNLPEIPRNYMEHRYNELWHEYTKLKPGPMNDADHQNIL